MDKGEMLERLARLFEEGRVVIPSRIPVELLRWRPPESDASLALHIFYSQYERLGTGEMMGRYDDPVLKFEISTEWPGLPEIPVNFKKVGGAMVAEIKVDLGILGEWETGDLTIDVETLEDSSKEGIEELVKDATEEIQYAFTRFILKLAAVALVTADEGYAPLVSYYERALGDLTQVPVEAANIL